MRLGLDNTFGDDLARGPQGDWFPFSRYPSTDVSKIPSLGETAPLQAGKSTFDVLRGTTATRARPQRPPAVLTRARPSRTQQPWACLASVDLPHTWASRP